MKIQLVLIIRSPKDHKTSTRVFVKTWLSVEKSVFKRKDLIPHTGDTNNLLHIINTGPSQPYTWKISFTSIVKIHWEDRVFEILTDPDSLKISGPGLNCVGRKELAKSPRALETFLNALLEDGWTETK